MLSEEEFGKILSALQQPHGIECLLLAYTYTHTPEAKYVWGHSKKLAQKIREKNPQFIANDGTVRRRWIKLEELGLLEAKPIDPNKNNYTTTPLGDMFAQDLIGSMYNTKKRMNRG